MTADAADAVGAAADAADRAGRRIDPAFPFRLDSRGRTAESAYDRHVRDMIEQLLFTSPGERVMRPDVGCGLADLVFAPNSPERAATVQLAVQAGLQRWLGDVVDVADLDAASVDSTITVRLSYRVRRTGTETVVEFVRTVP